MQLTGHDEYARNRAARDPEFARLRYQTAIELLDGNDEDRRIALRVLRDQLGLTNAAIQELQRKEATV